MLTKIQKIYSGLSLALVAMFGFATAGLCAPASTSEEVIDGVVGSGIDSVVTIVNHMVTTYFPYLLAFAVVGAIFGAIWKFAKIGSK